MSMDNQALVGGIINWNLLQIDFGERQTLREDAQEVSSRVARYTEPTAMVQRMCDYLAQIIALQKQITDSQTQ